MCPGAHPCCVDRIEMVPEAGHRLWSQSGGNRGSNGDTNPQFKGQSHPGLADDPTFFSFF